MRLLYVFRTRNARADVSDITKFSVQLLRLFWIRLYWSTNRVLCSSTKLFGTVFLFRDLPMVRIHLCHELPPHRYPVTALACSKSQLASEMKQFHTGTEVPDFLRKWISFPRHFSCGVSCRIIRNAILGLSPVHLLRRKRLRMSWLWV